MKFNICNEFETKDLDTLKRLLGIDIIRIDIKLFILKRSFIEKLLKRFSLFYTKPISFPLATHLIYLLMIFLITKKIRNI